MKYSLTEPFHVVLKRTKRLFQKKDGHMSTLDKLRLRFLKTGDHINSYKIFGYPVSFSFHPYWFRHSYKEIFEEEVYKFKSSNPNPVIIDCGSNIGLSIIYFKKLFPEARIIAFEPDDKIFNLLQNNLAAFNYSDVTLVNKAVWNSATVLKFDSTGGMGGSVLNNASSANRVIEIQAIRLRDYLVHPVAFLKIDIEGAEIPVLEDCKDRLNIVENLFVEYHCYPKQSQELVKLLSIVQEAGFRYYIRQASENMQFPFVEKHGRYCDIQLNIFCFRD
jgi:FkbM family methyltransferase